MLSFIEDFDLAGALDSVHNNIDIMDDNPSEIEDQIKSHSEVHRPSEDLPKMSSTFSDKDIANNEPNENRITSYLEKQRLSGQAPNPENYPNSNAGFGNFGQNTGNFINIPAFGMSMTPQSVFGANMHPASFGLNTMQQPDFGMNTNPQPAFGMNMQPQNPNMQNVHHNLAPIEQQHQQLINHQEPEHNDEMTMV